MTTMRYELDRADFDKWLETQGEREMGTMIPCDCPFSEYLSKILGEKVSCGGHYFRIAGGREYDLAPWAVRFSSLGIKAAPASALLAALRQIPEDAAC